MNLDLKKITINSFFNYLSIILTLVFGLISKIIFSRILTPFEIGIFFSTQVIFNFIFFFSGEWLSDSTAYYVAKDSKNKFKLSIKILHSSLLIASVLSLFAIFFCIVFIYFNSSFKTNNTLFFTILLIWLIVVPFRLLSFLLGSVYQGLGKLKIKILFHDLFPLCLIFLFLSFGYIFEVKSLHFAVASFALSYTIFSIVFFFNSYFKLINNDISKYEFNYKNIIHYGFPLFVSGIAYWPKASIPLLIGFVNSMENTAYFTFAISLSVLVYAPVSALEPASFPVWTKDISNREYNKAKKNFHFISIIGLFLSSIIFTTLFLCSSKIIIFLFGPEYLIINIPLKFLSLFFIIMALFGPLDGLLKAYGKTNFIFYSRFSETLIVILLFYPLLNHYFLNGAILLYIISSIVGLIIYIYATISLKIKLFFDFIYIKSIFSITISFIIILVIYKYINFNLIFLDILFITILYTIFLIISIFVFRIIKFKDLSEFKKIFE